MGSFSCNFSNANKSRERPNFSNARKSRERPNPFRLLVELLSAIGEWCLIIFLLINASLAYLATSFARLCKLPDPCLQCSRLGHIIGCEGHGFYRNLYCHAHRVEISSLVYCNDHRKLADFRDMCEACLVSSAAAAREAKSENSRPFRRDSLARLEDDANSCDRVDRQDMDGAPLLNKDLETASSGTWLCSCCSEPFTASTQSQVKRNKIEHGIPSVGVQLLKGQEKRLASSTPVDYPVSCSKLKLATDSESEVSLSDYDEDDEWYGSGQGSATIIKEDVVSEKLIHQTPVATTTKPMDEAGSWGKSSMKSTATTETCPEKVPQAVAYRTCGADSAPAATNPEIKKVSPRTSITSQAMNDPVPAPRVPVDRSRDSVRKSLSSRGGIMMSPRFSEMVVCKDSSRTPEEMKMRLSWALESSWSALASPKVDFGSPGVMALQNLARRLTVERSSTTSQDYGVNLIRDIEGETSIDLLKQQVELDRKSLSELYRELEEERNASAIAADESMAMINRLQEEKAAIQMEALQHLRMMEDQAEYDQEANQRLNDLLCDRERELLDMAAELESCKRQLRQVAEEKIRESMLLSQPRETPADIPRCIRKVLSDYTPAVTPRFMNSEPRRSRFLCRSKSENINVMPYPECTDYGAEDPVFSFVEEKAQLSACLKRLNKMLLLQSTKPGQSEENGLENGRWNDMDVENSSKMCSDTYRDETYPLENGNTEISALRDEVLRLIDRVEPLMQTGVSGACYQGTEIC